MRRAAFACSVVLVGLAGCDDGSAESAAASEPGAQTETAPARTRSKTVVVRPGAPGGEAEAETGEPPEIERPYDEEADADADIAAAVASASEADKHVLLMFGGNWCVWCRRLDYVFQNHDAVAAELRDHYELVHIDTGARGTGKNHEIDERYGNPTQHGFPVLVVLDGEGEQVTTQETGSLEIGDRHDPEKVLAFLRRARGG